MKLVTRRVPLARPRLSIAGCATGSASENRHLRLSIAGVPQPQTSLCTGGASGTPLGTQLGTPAPNVTLHWRSQWHPTWHPTWHPSPKRHSALAEPVAPTWHPLGTQLGTPAQTSLCTGGARSQWHPTWHPLGTLPLLGPKHIEPIGIIVIDRLLLCRADRWC